MLQRARWQAPIPILKRAGTNLNIAGEICNEWKTWSQYFGIRSIAATSLIQAITYVLLAVSTYNPSLNASYDVLKQIAYSGSAAVLVQTYAPYAFHTGSTCPIRILLLIKFMFVYSTRNKSCKYSFP